MGAVTGFAEYPKYDAVGLAKLIADKQVTRAEVLDAGHARLKQLNPRINAVVHDGFDQARQAPPPEADAPFAGVPLLIKDLAGAVAGMPLTSGSRFARNYIAKHDTELVRRYRQAGFAIVGKTNTPEFGVMSTTEPALFGPCRNPWNLDHSVGGSSGGSAAAVAARIVPAAHGTDGGGSLRIPAACCGVFGFKPSKGRTPLGAEQSDMARRVVVAHAVTLSVRDSAALLDATAGHSFDAPWSLPAPVQRFTDALTAPPRRLRIGVTTRSPIGTPIDPECVKAVEIAAALCRDLGHEVEEADIKYDAMQAFRDYIVLMCMDASEGYARLCMEIGREAEKEETEIGSRFMRFIGDMRTMADYATASAGLDRVTAEINAQHARYDAVLTPANATPPPKIGSYAVKGGERFMQEMIIGLKLTGMLKGQKAMDAAIVQNSAYIANFIPANITGQPAMSVPLHWTANELPIGAHFVGRFGEEATLFALAAQLEQAKPWADKLPSLLR